MDFWKEWLTGGGTLGLLRRLAILTAVALFAVFSLLLTLVVPGRVPHTFLAVLGVAAVLCAVIAPYLLSTFEQMQRQVTRQNHELRSLHAIDTAIHAEATFDAILSIAVREGTLAVDGEWGAVWLFDSPPSHAPLARAFYNVPPYPQSLLQDGPGSLLPGAQPPDGPQRRRELETTWGQDRLAGTLKARNLIAVPLRWRDTTLGLFLIGNRGGALTPLQGFTRDDEQLLGAIAATVALAVQNVRLNREAQRRNELLRSLVARTGEAIAASSDAPRLMEILTDEAGRIVGCPRAAVYDYDPTSRQLTPLAAQDARPQHAEELTRLRRDPLLIPALPDRPDDAVPYFTSVTSAFGLTGDAAPLLARPGYAFVLRARDRSPLGLLCLLDDAPRTLAPETTEFARALAAQAAVALENAQLARQAQQLLARTQALQEATGRIAAERDLERVVRGVMDSAGRVLGAESYALWEYNEPSGAWTCRRASGMSLAAAAQTREAVDEAVLTQAYAERRPLPAGDTLALPLLSAGDAVGVLTLSYPAAQAIPGDEIALAQSFAQQAANALQNAKLFTELDALYRKEKRIAQTLQESLLPVLPPRAGAFEPDFKYVAALDGALIGGDFLDWFPLGPGRVGLVMADVSGKGLTAAVQTAMIKYTLRGFASECPAAPGVVLARVNDVLCGELGGHDGFVTLFYGVLDTATGVLTYANAGHEPPLHRDGGTGIVTALAGAGIVLGCLPGAAYDEAALTLGPEDLLLLYTDGLTEARDAEGRFLNQSGLAALLPPRGLSAGAAVEAILAQVRDYANGNLHDDTAMLLIRCLPLHLAAPLQAAPK